MPDKYEEKTMSETTSKPMPELVPANESGEIQADFLFGVYQFALSFFRDQFWQSPEAVRFCVDRGISESRLQDEKIGYAPQPEPVDEFAKLLQRHCSAQVCRESGLFSWKEGAAMDMYSRFRNRLMFPIYDDNDHVIAFSGLALDPDHRKGPEWLEFSATWVYDPADPPANLKNIAMRVLQLQASAAASTPESRIFVPPLHALVKMVGRMGQRYGDRPAVPF